MKSQPNERILLEDYASVTSLESLVQGYLLNCRCESKSTATIANYQYRLACFLWFCQHSGYPDEPQKITANHIRHFLWYLSSQSNRWGSGSTSARKPASESTVNHYYHILSAFFGWLKREEFIGDNPTARLKPPKMNQKVVQALKPTEVEVLLTRCSSKSFLDIRNRIILMMLIDTGLRVFELANLRLDDIDMNTGSILVRHGKGNKQRVVRIGTKTQKALWKYATLYRRSDSDKLLVNRSGEPLDVTGIKLMVRRLGKRADIQGVHVHRLRHTFAISFLRAGGDVFSLQYLLGHTTLAMTQRYLQSLNADDAVKAHQRFSPIDNLFTK